MEYLDIAAERLRSDALRFYSALLLPYVYQDTDDIQAWRKSFKKNLRALAKRGLVISDPFSMEGVPQATPRTISSFSPSLSPRSMTSLRPRSYMAS